MQQFETRVCVSAALLAAALAFSSVPASTAPLSVGGGILQSQTETAVLEVQFRRPRRDAAGAFIAGAIIGGIIGSQYPYTYYPYPYTYYPAYPVYPRVYSYDAAIAYCIRRFRSYDPYSRTYLGYDGRRHPCP